MTLGHLECSACGRRLTNEPGPRLAHWTFSEPRLPYCADSPQCEKDALAEEAMAAGVQRPL